MGSRLESELGNLLALQLVWLVHVWLVHVWVVPWLVPWLVVVQLVLRLVGGNNMPRPFVGSVQL